MMNLTIEAKSVEELKTKIMELAEKLGALELPDISETSKEPKSRVKASDSVEIEKPAKKKAEKKTPPASDKNAAIEALKKVNSEKGIETARSLLLNFSCEKISDLPLEKVQAFIDECEKAVSLDI